MKTSSGQLHQNRQTNNIPLIAVLKTTEVAVLLNVKPHTVHDYVAKGLLIKVTGAGKLPLDISRDSYVRFTEKSF